MTAVNFPDNPAINETFSVGDRTWKWTGTTWDAEVTLQITGPTGPTGPAGPKGDTGEPGTTPVISKIHTQNAPSATWVIVNDLNFYPNIVTTDTAGTIIEGDVSYTNSSTITITFSQSISGYAYLSQENKQWLVNF